MHELNTGEAGEVSGGLSYFTPAMVALADTGALGPLTTAFGIGYAIGTFAYNLYWE